MSFVDSRVPLRLFVYSVVVIGAMVGALVWKLRVQGVFACPASYGNTAYLSDCNAPAYGDYDHGAFWFGLEPEASRAVQRAKVLFIGNSRVQFALSTAQAAQWFAQASISYYLLGFSASETVAYTAPLLKKIRPQASVYVVNVDRFFDDRVSPPAAQILQGKDILSRYRQKQFWQHLHKRICGTLNLFCGEAFGVYRSRVDGSWRGAGSPPTAAAGVSEGEPTNVERWPAYTLLAKTFLADLPIDRRCVLLTLVPTAGSKRAEAQAIADALGMPLIAPAVDGLKTFDGSHLDHASAERWSQAFLAAAGPSIRSCAAAPAPAARDRGPLDANS
ncbi:MAG TPA: hypothetical protein VMG60_09760 [Burkholderiaceae bacterium]|nr:hypothetical protein [Burkholderiaceae bacterium]